MLIVNKVTATDICSTEILGNKSQWKLHHVWLSCKEGKVKVKFSDTCNHQHSYLLYKAGALMTCEMNHSRETWHYFIWQCPSLCFRWQQAVQRCACCYSNTLQVGRPHVLVQCPAVSTVLGIYSPYLKQVLEMFFFSLHTRTTPCRHVNTS